MRWHKTRLENSEGLCDALDVWYSGDYAIAKNYCMAPHWEVLKGPHAETYFEGMPVGSANTLREAKAQAAAHMEANRE